MPGKRRVPNEAGDFQCSKCKAYKHASEFRKDKSMTYGLSSTCTYCIGLARAQKLKPATRWGKQQCCKCGQFKQMHEFRKVKSRYATHTRDCIRCQRGKQMISRRGDEAECRQCLQWKQISEFPKEKGNTAGFIGTCKACSCINEKAQNSRSIKCFLRSKLHTTRNNQRETTSSRRKKFECTVLLEDLVNQFTKQQGRCAISGVIMTTIAGCGKVGTNISIDRIDCDKGYTKDNVRLVCVAVNYMRNNMTDAQLGWWCEQVCKHQRKPAKRRQENQLTLFNEDVA